MKKIVITMFLPTLMIALFLASNLVQAQLVIDKGQAPSDAQIAPLEIIMLSPSNQSIYSQKQVLLDINVTLPEHSPLSQTTFLQKVSCHTDWLTDGILLYYNTYGNDSIDNRAPAEKQFLKTSINITGVPEGKHNLTLTAEGRGYYIIWGDLPLQLYHFETKSSSTISFTIDTLSPSIRILSIENRIYETSNLALNFTVDEATSKLAYNLDSKGNVTMTDNITLTGLSNGKHSITVYAQDVAGNMGASETIDFEISVLFSTVLMVIVFVAVLGVVVAGLLIYFRKRKHQIV
ncbi:MAG TPA: hypothetical protein VK209_04695 [Candidatus Sulfotelmatobacter sp.]|nr:hypothetical protein [Candidatus Sulfotelmatobacter sp.]